MRLFLLGCIALFVLVIITAAVKTKASNKQATRKRRKERRTSSSHTAKPLDQLFEENSAAGDAASQLLDADEALGLKPQSAANSEFEFELESEPEPEPEQPVVQPVEQPVIKQKPKLKYVVLNVMAPKDQEFSGYELLQALLANGLRYGKDKIFHRHQNKSGQGEVLFSLASVNRPGTFDLPNMGSFSCPGLAMFLVLKDVAHPLQAFDLMFETAQKLIDDLGGELWDEKLQPLCQEDACKIRDEIQRSYETNLAANDLFIES